MASGPWRLCFAVMAAVALAESVVAQQVDIRSVKVKGPDDTGLPASKLDELEEHYVVGDLEKARSVAEEIIDVVAKRTKAEAYDYRSNILAVMWAGSDAAGEKVMRRLLLPAPSLHPFSLDLPGLQPGDRPPQLFEVLLSLDQRSTLVSQYSFTRESNPILAEIPSAAEALVGPLFGFIDVVKPVGGRRVATVPLGQMAPTIWATASRVAIPFARATVKVKSSAKIPISMTDWKGEVGQLSEALAYQIVPRSTLARSCITKYEMHALAIAETEVCLGPKASASKCLDAFDTAFSEGYRECLTIGKPEKADIEALQVVDDKYRELVMTGRAARVEGDAEFRNAPRTHFSFGLGIAFVLTASLGEDRAKLDDSGTLILDPMSRQMTMLMLHWSPRGYDAEAPKIQPTERWRLFAAGVLTPDLGLAAGASVLVVRGVGLNAGVGVVFAKTPNAGDTIGSPPSNATDAFAATRGWIAFAGINVGFK